MLDGGLCYSKENSVPSTKTSQAQTFQCLKATLLALTSGFLLCPPRALLKPHCCPLFSTPSDAGPAIGGSENVVRWKEGEE